MILDNSYDPLFVVNPKLACLKCENERKKRGSCDVCKGSGMRPVDLCGMWYPAAGFLVCGGPSLNKIPYHRLQERGVLSFGVNNVSAYAPVNGWCFSDPQSKFHHGLFLDPKCLTFAPIPKLKKHVRAKLPNGDFIPIDSRVRDCPGTFGFDRKTLFYPEEFLTTDWAHWGMGGKQGDDRPFTCLCTMLLGIRLMHYLGFRRVYMIGVDFNMTDLEQYSFGQKKKARNGRYQKENEMLKQLKPIFDKKDFKLYNCNPDSNCDVFPHVTFEDALSECKNYVPDGPFDLDKWYDSSVAEHFDEKYKGVIMSKEDLRKLQEKKS